MGRSHVCAVDGVYIFTPAAISVRYTFRPIGVAPQVRCLVGCPVCFMAHTGRCTEICVDWLANLLALLSSHPRVDWGVHLGGGGVLMMQFDVMSSYRVPGGTILLLPCTNQMIVRRTTGVVGKTTFTCCLVHYSERRL